jgi:hypothetical protein
VLLLLLLPLEVPPDVVLPLLVELPELELWLLELSTTTLFLHDTLTLFVSTQLTVLVEPVPLPLLMLPQVTAAAEAMTVDSPKLTASVDAN